MPSLALPTDRIHDWDSFHTECARVFGFPAFYGKNMNAWVDCLSDLGEDDTMSTVKLKPGEVLLLRIPGFEAFSRRLPEVCAALLGSTAFVNTRYAEARQDFRIALLLE